MKLFAKILVVFLASVGGLIAADYFVAGFSVTHDPKDFLILASIFTLLQLILRPILRVLFLPIIFITLGLFTLVINGMLLYILDFWSANLTIEGLGALMMGTLIITAAHFIATILWYPFK